MIDMHDAVNGRDMTVGVEARTWCETSLPFEAGRCTLT